jgi:DnaJ family protein B protein 11
MAHMGAKGWFVVVLLATAAVAEDYYSVLGLDRRADDDAIKRAYRALARKWHPDKNPERKKEAEEKFRQVSSAYEVLSDPEKRRIYDQHGEEGLREHAQGGSAGSGGMGFSDPSDIFAQFFGGSPFGFGAEEEQEEDPRGADVEIGVHCSLVDLYTGHTASILRRKGTVKTAPGTRECRCKTRMKTKQMGPGMFQQFPKQECERCSNAHITPEQITLQAEVEPGMRDGSVITFPGQGEPDLDGEPGDLKLRIQQSPHPTFKRNGDDLHTSLSLSLLEALVGFNRSIEHLDGHSVPLTSDEIIRPGDTRSVPNEGMPNQHSLQRKGQLHVLFDVAFPSALSEEQRSLARQLFATESFAS